MKEKIIGILKQFEQADYKRGGVSLAPETYDAVTNNHKDKLPTNLSYVKSALEYTPWYKVITFG